jgi:tetratricopeptide (TPR) repeat protein
VVGSDPARVVSLGRYFPRENLVDALARSGQAAEAVARYRAALALAPSRRDLREALIGELTRSRQYAEALAECRRLAESLPKDVDVLKRLGQLTLKAAPEAKRAEAETQAVEVWTRIAAIRPDDPVLALEVAEVCRQAAAVSKSSGAASPATAPRESFLRATAEAFYREAVQRSKGAPDHVEDLGEFLHSLGRKRDAVAAWAAMAAAPHDSAADWRRLADVYDRFGYLDDALTAGEKSLVAEPDSFAGHKDQLRMLLKKQDHEKALAEVDQLDRLADSSARIEEALRARLTRTRLQGEGEAIGRSPGSRAPRVRAPNR